MESKTDAAWEELLKQNEILAVVDQKGFYDITADCIKKVREPRLMTKFDHHDDLPLPFLKNHLSIMPKSRNLFTISHQQMFSPLKKVGSLFSEKTIPSYIESLKDVRITSEALALNCAYSSGILSDFLDEKGLVPTISGRMSSSAFSFDILNVETKKKDRINVDGSQIEIDGGYEGERYLTLVEAKMSLQPDFLIRQLYYPFRLWSQQVHKPIRLVYLVYSNGLYRLYEYQMKDLFYYNSIAFVGEKNYAVTELQIDKEIMMKAVEAMPVAPEPNIPFPQANCFERVINLLELLAKNDQDRDSLSDEYQFVPRQADYYMNACRYLGLVEKENGRATLSPEGRRLGSLPYKERQLALLQKMGEHRVLRESLLRSLKMGRTVEDREIVDIMQRSHVLNVKSAATLFRRANCVKNWCQWATDIARSDNGH